MNVTKLIFAITAAVACTAAQATTITFTFLEDGTGNLGHSRTFTEHGVSLTATASPGQDLYGKHGGGDENGLGIAAEDDHEIDGRHFIQLTVPTTPGTHFKTISLGSVQPGELAKIYFSTTLGVLGNPVAGGVVSADGTFDVSHLGPGYIGISGGGTGGADVLLDSLVVETIPDGGATAVLLGSAMTCFAVLRKKLLV